MSERKTDKGMFLMFGARVGTRLSCLNKSQPSCKMPCGQAGQLLVSSLTTAQAE